MEKNNYLTLGLTALGGVVVGVALMGLIWYENPCTETGTKFLPEEIPDVPTANKYFHNFYDAATTDKIKGINVDKDALQGIGQIFKDNPGFNNFMIYFGSDSPNAVPTMGIIVGVENTGDDATAKIYRFSFHNGGPCPPACDRPNISPITQ